MIAIRIFTQWFLRHRVSRFSFSKSLRVKPSHSQGKIELLWNKGSLTKLNREALIASSQRIVPGIGEFSAEAAEKAKKEEEKKAAVEEAKEKADEIKLMKAKVIKKEMVVPTEVQKLSN